MNRRETLVGVAPPAPCSAPGAAPISSRPSPPLGVGRYSLAKDAVPRPVALPFRSRGILAVAFHAWEDGRRAAHLADPPQLRTARALEAFGLVTITPTGTKCAGHPEYDLRITDAGVEAYRRAVAP